MKNKLITENIVQRLLSPEEWKLVTTFLPQEAEPVPENEVPDLEAKKFDRHFRREILVPLEGEYVYGFNGKYYRCAPGTIFFIDSEIKHESFYTGSASGLIHLWLFVDSDKVFVNYITVNNGQIEYVNRLNTFFRSPSPEMNLYSIWSSLQGGMPEGSMFYHRRRLLLTLAWFFLRLIEYNANPSSDLKEYQHEVIEAAKAHIRKNFKRGIRIDQMAAISGYSKFHFLRLFKEYSGITIYGYINICRENEVERLLESHHTLSEIADELGFSSLSSFSNWRKNTLRLNTP